MRHFDKNKPKNKKHRDIGRPQNGVLANSVLGFVGTLVGRISEKNKIEAAALRGFDGMSVYMPKVRNSSP